MRYVQQLDEADCCAACISMILSFYKIVKSVTNIREFAGTDIMGTNLLGMIKAFKEFGFKASGLKGERESISSELPVPFIAHIKKEMNGNLFNHYVVIKK